MLCQPDGPPFFFFKTERTILCSCLKMVLTFRWAVHSFCSTSLAEACSKLLKVSASQTARYLMDKVSTALATRCPWGRPLLQHGSQFCARRLAIGALVEFLLDRLGPPVHFCQRRIASRADCSAHLSSCSMFAAMPSWSMHRRSSCVTPRSAGRSDEGKEHGMAFVVAGVFH